MSKDQCKFQVCANKTRVVTILYFCLCVSCAHSSSGFLAIGSDLSEEVCAQQLDNYYIDLVSVSSLSFRSQLLV